MKICIEHPEIYQNIFLRIFFGAPKSTVYAKLEKRTNLNGLSKISLTLCLSFWLINSKAKFNTIIVINIFEKSNFCVSLNSNLATIRNVDSIKNIRDTYWIRFA